MKAKCLYSFWVVLTAILIGACNSGSNKIPPLNETFAQKDKNPFGAFVVHRQLEQLYYHNTIRVAKDNFENTWQNLSDTGSVYICICKNLFLSTADMESMLAYVYNGNSLFISSSNIDDKLLDTLGLEVGKYFKGQYFTEMEYTAVKLATGIFNDSNSYKYFYIPFYDHFTKMDTFRSKILGINDEGANYATIFHGKGRFYLHTEPRALSNYFLLQKNNYKYFQQIFSITHAIPEHVYWDDYYNKKNYPGIESDRKKGLAVLLQYPEMAWAFWLFIALMGLYILFGGKRRQRIVATISPNTNTTLAFTETISHLYLQQKDNRNIADKLITYLLEFIRNQYFLNTSHFNDEFITTLSRKSNNSKAGTEQLFKSIGVIHQSTEISDQQLLLLNAQVENFYKNQL